MNVTKAEFDTHFAFIEKLEDAFIRYAAEVGIKDANRYSFDDAHDNYVEFRWHETWSYGGEKMHEHCMPLEFLFDYETWKAKHEAEQGERFRLETKRKERTKAAQEKSEREQLKTLKERYETGSS